MVSSIDTRSTQSKVSPNGRESSTSPVRRRISASSSASRAGATAGVTDFRCTSCTGGSLAMKFRIAKSSGWSPRTMSRSEEKTPWLLSTATMSSNLVTDQ